MNEQRGFTLIETVIFIMVLAVGLTGLVSLSTTVTKDSAAPLIRERTLVIAHGYMDEIISKRWHENTPVGGGCIDSDGNLATPGDSCTAYCSVLSDFQCSRSKCNLTAPANCQAANVLAGPLAPEGAETRAIFDDIDDYNGIGTPPQDIFGNPVPGYAGYTVGVVVGAHPGAPGLWNGIPSADVRRIAVSVTNPLGETLTLVSYRVNF